MPVAENRTLVIGYGNPGRQDDGLGPALITALDMLAIPGIETRVNYQLTVEDSIDIARFERVIFADACIRGNPFSFAALDPEPAPALGSHSISPPALMELTRSLFGVTPDAYLLAIRGYEFDLFEESLSPNAEDNLRQATDYLYGWLQAHPLIKDIATTDELNPHADSERSAGPSTAGETGHA